MHNKQKKIYLLLNLKTIMLKLSKYSIIFDFLIECHELKIILINHYATIFNFNKS